MGFEIERKFLVKTDEYKKLGTGEKYVQGYLSRQKERVVRIRRAGEEAFMTIKGITKGATRLEYEYEIPADEADEILKKLCEHPLIEKTRYKIRVDHDLWEVDEFHGFNEGLVIAEIELLEEDDEFSKPKWLGAEITLDSRYYNSNLITKPFRTWTAEEE